MISNPPSCGSQGRGRKFQRKERKKKKKERVPSSSDKENWTSSPAFLLAAQGQGSLGPLSRRRRREEAITVHTHTHTHKHTSAGEIFGGAKVRGAAQLLGPLPRADATEVG